MHPAESVADLVKALKGMSSKWINDTFWHGRFSWQSGYGAFSYSRSLVPEVKKYIENQREHHRRISFREEVERMFQKAGIEYTVVDAEEDVAMTEKYGVRQAPTLIVTDGESFNKITNVSNIKKFIEETKTETV